MSRIVTYRFFRESVTFLLLIGILLGNMSTYFSWLIDPELEVAEYNLPIENDSEGNEEKTEAEKDIKIRSEFSLLNSLNSALAWKVFNYLNFNSNYKPDTPTPPPELNPSFS